ncbi:MarR family transcriptional regulator [Ramlibacter sp. AN1015]|uniref:MarR family transcriptional regulator n=1 Tax=Ramlibacter sp. AN1015 TaxID=3133428 RepID=UPI0030BEDBB9
MKSDLTIQEEFGLRLGLVARLWRAEIDRRLASVGVSESRWLALLHISRLPHGVTQRELAEALGVQGPTLVRTLDRLEAEGLIERRTEAGDRRTKSVHLPAETAHVLQRIEMTAATVRAEILSDISPAEMTTCLRVFDKIAGKLGGAEAAMHLRSDAPMDS